MTRLQTKHNSNINSYVKQKTCILVLSLVLSFIYVSEFSIRDYAFRYPLTYLLYIYIFLKKKNYKHVLRDLNIDDFKSKPPDCTCASSPFKYNPTGHVIAGDLKIINNTSLREVFAKGPKYREPKSIYWK